MITHIVLLKPKPEVSEDQIASALEHIQALQQAIPGIINVQVGANLNGTNNQGYTHGFVMQFASTEIFKGYAPHPAHQPVSQELRQISDGIIDFNIEGN